ncbi:MAG TPA: hypothetical protein VHM64_12555, partial [Candidatus Binatia bacterium]|nr:hypothetical protein [Candidatus Binatia bacterium]
TAENLARQATIKKEEDLNQESDEEHEVEEYKKSEPFVLLCLKIFAGCANLRSLTRRHKRNSPAKHVLSHVEGTLSSQRKKLLFFRTLAPLRRRGRHSDFLIAALPR